MTEFMVDQEPIRFTVAPGMAGYTVGQGPIRYMVAPVMTEYTVDRALTS